MDKFTTLEGVAAPLNIINVDTDMPRACARKAWSDSARKACAFVAACCARRCWIKRRY